MNIKTLSLSILSLAGITLLGSSCSLLDPDDVAAIPLSTSDCTQSRTQIAPTTGTIHSIQLLDSHTWAVQSEEGTWYDPVNLPDSLKVEGAKVTFEYRKAADWGYTYTSGELIKITQISRTK